MATLKRQIRKGFGLGQISDREKLQMSIPKGIGAISDKELKYMKQKMGIPSQELKRGFGKALGNMGQLPSKLPLTKPKRRKLPGLPGSTKYKIKLA